MYDNKRERENLQNINGRERKKRKEKWIVLGEFHCSICIHRVHLIATLPQRPVVPDRLAPVFRYLL